MNLKLTLIGTLTYTVVTFPLAVIWHVVLFEERYLHFGYFERDPSFILGLLAIVIQGFVMSLLFPLVNLPGKPIVRGLRYSLIIGAFFWTSHVIAYVAKNAVESSIAFVLMESFYLILQFGIYGICIGLVYGKTFQGDA